MARPDKATRDYRRAQRNVEAYYRLLYAAAVRFSEQLGHWDAARDLKATGPRFAGRYGERGDQRLRDLATSIERVRQHLETDVAAARPSAPQMCEARNSAGALFCKQPIGHIGMHDHYVPPSLYS